MVRRLPVLRDAPPEEGEARPRYQWVLIDALFTTVFWAPLIAVAMPLGARLASRLPGGAPGGVLEARDRPSSWLFLAALGVVLPLFTFLVAAALAGALAARFGRNLRPRDTALGAVLGALVVSALTALSGVGLPSPTAALAGFLSLSAAGALGGVLGGAWGVRKR